MPISTADPAAFAGLGIQSALGTPQTAAAKFRFSKYLAGTNVALDQTVEDLREGGDGLDFGYSYKSGIKAAGQLVFNMRPEFLGQLLAILPGGATWDGGSAPAIHTMHTGHASHPYGTLQVGHPATSIVGFYGDVRFTGLTLAYEAGKPILVTAPFTAMTIGASSTVLTPTYYADDPFLFYNTPTYLLDGASAPGFTGFTVDFALGVEELMSAAITLDDIVVQNRDTNVTVTRRYENPTLWKKVYYSGGVAPSTNVATGALDLSNAYGAGANLRQFRTIVPLMSYRSNVLTELDPDGKTVMETISAKALKGATSAAILQLTNGHASAYGA